MLRDAHGPGDDDLLGPQVALGQFVDFFAAQAGGLKHFALIQFGEVLLEFLQPLAVLLEELVVQHAARVPGFGVENALGHRLQERHVPAQPDLQELVGNLRAVPHDALDLLRVLIAAQSGLGQRVNGNDLAAGFLGFLEGGEHARVVGARVLPHDDDQVRLREIIVGDGGLADADGLAHAPAGGLMAHVGAVRQVVGSVCPHEQLVQEGGLVRGPAASVERRLVGARQALQFAAQDGEGFVPADRPVVVLPRRLVHRFGQPSLHPEPVFGHPPQFADRVLRPEFRGDKHRGGLPRDSFGTVLAELERLAVAGVRPRATHAVEAVLLVQCQQRLEGPLDAHLLNGGLHGVVDAGKTRGPILWFAHLKVVLVGFFHARGLPGHAAPSLTRTCYSVLL
ncbi:hypothetical protein D9M72_354990 [compost metagenome]